MKGLLKSLRNRLKTTSAQNDNRLLEEVPFTVLDIETTGLNFQTDEILAIGAVRLIGSRILVGTTFYRLVRPTQTAWANTVAIHRILPADISAASTLEPVLAEFGVFCAESILVGHQVHLDRTFLTRHEPSLQDRLWLDTHKVARWLESRNRRLQNQPPLETGRLSVLAHYYQVPIPIRHHALADAFITAQIWQRQLAELRVRGLHHVDEVARIGQI